jgi:hypothetical protein
MPSTIALRAKAAAVAMMASTKAPARAVLSRAASMLPGSIVRDLALSRVFTVDIVMATAIGTPTRTAIRSHSNSNRRARASPAAKITIAEVTIKSHFQVVNVHPQKVKNN